jgi:hypothetical protein
LIHPLRDRTKYARLCLQTIFAVRGVGVPALGYVWTHNKWFRLGSKTARCIVITNASAVPLSGYLLGSVPDYIVNSDRDVFTTYYRRQVMNNFFYGTILLELPWSAIPACTNM